MLPYILSMIFVISIIMGSLFSFFKNKSYSKISLYIRDISLFIFTLLSNFGLALNILIFFLIVCDIVTIIYND